MSSFWKVLLGALVTLPMLAYFTGTLVASGADSPEQPRPAVISETPSTGLSPSNLSSPSSTEDPDGEGPTAPRADDDHSEPDEAQSDDNSGDESGDDRSDEDEDDD